LRGCRGRDRMARLKESWGAVVAVIVWQDSKESWGAVMAVIVWQDSKKVCLVL